MSVHGTDGDWLAELRAGIRRFNNDAIDDSEELIEDWLPMAKEIIRLNKVLDRCSHE